MRKTLFIGLAVVAALCAAGAAYSSGVLGGGPAQIRIYGGGQVATPTAFPRTISLDANASPQGRGAYGTLRYAGVAPGWRGDVTCVTVDGSNALVGGFVQEPTAFAGSDFLYAVSDNGAAGSNADRAGFLDLSPELDTPAYPGLPADFPRTCPGTIDLNVFGSFPLAGDVSIETP